MIAGLWQPVSGCGPHCRETAGRHAFPGVPTLRMMGLAVVLVGGLLLAPLLRGLALRGLARTMLAVLGIRVVRRGPELRPGSLLVANHVSWLDILVLMASSPMSLVAKGEVGAWPGIGPLAGLSGAIFIDRSRPKALPSTVAEVAAALRSGRTVAAFPEGTTFCGTNQGRFRPALFQAAVDAGAPVVPASIRYDSTDAAFIGDDTLFDSIRRVAALRSLTVTLVTAPALRPEPGADRRLLARAAQASMGVAGYRLAA
ncbi:lysophospholipid acyltransferase family protein [Actinoplanes sp. Pm04-4]|jgi:1-acyl-sn-glycerol-3-phosphate acyltransferase|uniref:Lysophospholipid acyltransferase family protein n=1 Tax=Paractinoplanes pyxinae TaxID=2997416 RepID=A0ABT4B263_9ACTN|nr:lysophospholipid acyltransferase family protein [Actinoplanes pyxinae]MCY1140584.1 lysophospholipid acyltransferase family protein [Actinoplanes pyxinae]